MIKFVKHFIFIVLILAMQVAFLPYLNESFSSINFVLVVLLFIALAYKFYLSVVYAFIIGIVLDIFSVLPFGAITIALLITLYLIFKIFEKFITNKSFYAFLGLTVLATLIFDFINYIYLGLFYFYKANDLFLFKKMAELIFNDLIMQLILNLVIAMIFFVIFYFTSKRFNAVFIDTTKN